MFGGENRGALPPICTMQYIPDREMLSGSEPRRLLPLSIAKPKRAAILVLIFTFETCTFIFINDADTLNLDSSINGRPLCQAPDCLLHAFMGERVRNIIMCCAPSSNKSLEMVALAFRPRPFPFVFK